MARNETDAADVALDLLAIQSSALAAKQSPAVAAARLFFEQGNAQQFAVRSAVATPLDQAADGYKNFDRRADGWTKVLLKPGLAAA